nr:hypothetical protein [Comamonas testosteroni]
MTTAKSIPGLLRKLADFIERALGGTAHAAEAARQRRAAQCQRNAEVLAELAIQQNRLERKKQRRQQSEDVTAACFAAGLLDQHLLPECGDARTKTLNDGSDLGTKGSFLNHRVEGLSCAVDTEARAFTLGDLAVNSQRKTQGFANDIERVITKTRIVIYRHNKPSQALCS